MRHRSLPTLLLLTSLPMHAQTLTLDSVLIRPGDAFVYATMDDVINPGASGPDRIWDFSVPTSTPLDVRFGWTAVPAQSESFPEGSAGFSLLTVPEAATVYTNDVQGRYYHGSVAPGALTVCTDPREDLRFPLTLFATWTDPFASRTWDDAATLLQEDHGHMTATVDAFGTLYLEWGALYNVARVHTVTDTWSTVPTAPDDTVHVREDAYLFYKPGLSSEVVRVSTRTSEGGDPQHSWRYMVSDNVGIRESAMQAIGVDVFPVPATDRITVSYGTAGDATLHISDALGHVLIAQAGTDRTAGLHRQELDVHALAPGVYFLEVRNAQGERGIRRFVVR